MIHACARIVTFYAGIVSKEEVILIHAYARIAALLLGGSVIVLIHTCARIAMVQVGRQAGVGTILIHACARIVAGSG